MMLTLEILLSSNWGSTFGYFSAGREGIIAVVCADNDGFPVQGLRKWSNKLYIRIVWDNRQTVYFLNE